MFAKTAEGIDPDQGAVDTTRRKLVAIGQGNWLAPVRHLCEGDAGRSRRFKEIPLAF
jgi:hypothetical protein